MTPNNSSTVHAHLKERQFEHVPKMCPSDMNCPDTPRWVISLRRRWRRAGRAGQAGRAGRAHTVKVKCRLRTATASNQPNIKVLTGPAKPKSAWQALESRMEAQSQRLKGQQRHKLWVRVLKGKSGKHPPKRMTN